MAIKIGNKDIIAIFKGDKEITEVFRGTDQVFASKTEAPTLSFVSATETSITLRIFNNDKDNLTDIEISYASQTFTQGSLSIGTGLTQDFTIQNLTPGISFNFIAIADANGKGFSDNSNTITNSTLANKTPDINFISATTSALTFTFKNNNGVQSNIRTTITSGSSPSTVLANSTLSVPNLGAGLTSTNITFSGLNSFSTHTVAAKAEISGNLSGQATSTQTTINLAPTVTFLSRTQTSINMRFTNNNNVSSTIRRAIGTSCQNITTSTGGSSVGAGLTVDQNFTGLVINTSYCITARADIGGNLSNQAQSTQSTLSNQTPTINFISVTSSSLTFSFTNNNSVSANIRTTFTAGGSATNVTASSTISASGLGSGATSSNVTFSGLAAFSTHTVAARAEISGNLSGQASTSATTNQAAPSIALVGRTQNSINMRFTNNNSVTSTIRRAIGTSCQTVTTSTSGSSVSSGSTVDQNFTGLAINTSYCITARADISGSLSDQASSTQSTLANQTPTITFVSATSSVLNFNFRNNNNITANIRTTIAAGSSASNVTASSTLSVSNLGANTTSGTIGFTNLGAFSTHTVAARAEIGGNLSGQASNTRTTDQAAPSISILSSSLTSLFVRFTNNNSVTSTIRRAIGTSCQTITAGTSGSSVTTGATVDQTFSSLTPGTSYCVSARADISGNLSGQTNQNGSTNSLTRPTISQVSRGVNNIT